MAHKVPIEFQTEEDVNRVYINGIDVTEQIRTPEVTARVSEVSAHKGVREAMVAKQKERRQSRGGFDRRFRLLWTD